MASQALASVADPALGVLLLCASAAAWVVALGVAAVSAQLRLGRAAPVVTATPAALEGETHTEKINPGQSPS